MKYLKYSIDIDTQINNKSDHKMITNALYSNIQPYQMHQGSKMREQQQLAQKQTQQLLKSSKRLIQEIQNRKFKNYASKNSVTSIQKQNQSNFLDGQASNMRISTKNKIQGTRKSLQHKTTIAQQIFSKNKNQISNNQSRKQSNTNLDNQKQDYLKLVEQMLGCKKRDRRKSKNKKYQVNQSSDQSTRKFNKEPYLSTRQIQYQLKRDAARNAGMKLTHSAQQNEDNPINSKVKLAQNMQQQLQAFDSRLQKSSKNMQKEERSLRMPSNTNRISIKVPSYPKIGNSQQMELQKQQIQLSLSQSSKQDQTVTNLNKNNIKQDDFFRLLSKQIDNDIENLKSKKQIQKQDSGQNYKKVKQHDNYNKFSGTTDMKQTQHSQKIIKLNQQQTQNTDNNLNNKFEDKNKNGSYLYSFRQDQATDLSKLLLMIPKQDKKNTKNNYFDSNNNDNSQSNLNSHEHHQDYNTGLDQQKIQRILLTIQRRIKFSPAVIDSVAYEHSIRQDNNQLQIDQRYMKERKDRDQIKRKIVHYDDTKNGYARAITHKIPRIKNQIQRQAENLIKFDQTGKKMFVSDQFWRSPGKYKTNSKFSALNSPILNGQGCCQPKKSKIIENSLLKCRSADNLANLSYFNRNYQHNKFDDSNTNLLRHNFTQQGLDTQILDQDKNSSCLIKQWRWPKIQKIRKDIQIFNIK